MKYELAQVYSDDSISNNDQVSELLEEGWEPFAAFSKTEERREETYDDPYRYITKVATVEVLLLRRLVK